jgi:mannose-6-phosphate isomerase-like protein (cupin superfamily)
MNEVGRSLVVRMAEARRRIQELPGEHATCVLHRGTADVALSIPVTPIPQSPHAQDEIYVVIRGHGVMSHDGHEDQVTAGDLIFVAAGTEHQFVEVHDGFAVWRIFYGRGGGEVPDALS